MHHFISVVPTLAMSWLAISALVVVAIIVVLLTGVVLKWGAYWFQAYMSGAEVTFASLIVMSLLRIDQRIIVTAKIMGHQAGLNTGRLDGMSTARLQAHHLAGGDVMKVVRAIIAAQRANIDLDFDQAAAIDLAGRDVLDAVQTSISPKVIYCPRQDRGDSLSRTLSAVALNGVELRVSARVTVRTNLNQLIGGATEETIIARVGQGIISAIGSSASHMDVLEMPSQISKGALANGLDANTAFSIVSIDIADIDVGENIGARLQTDQAEADTRVARAAAEARRALAIATEQEMRARTTAARASFIRAEALIPSAIAEAFLAGRIHSSPRNRKGTSAAPSASSFVDRL